MNVLSGKLPGWSVGVLLSLLASAATAETPEVDAAAITLSTEAQISLIPLVDETLAESGTVTVQPRDDGSPEGALSEALPPHCLMSVYVSLGGEQAEFEAGKMVCVTEDRRILELLPDADIEALGECESADGAACGRFVIRADEPGRLSLRSEGQLMPQPRNVEN